MRLAPIGQASGAPLDFSTSTVDYKYSRGTMLLAAATDLDTTANVANWGLCELMYVAYASASVQLLPGTLVATDKNFRITATAVAATVANSGTPVSVALSLFDVNTAGTQHGWVLRAGICPVKYSVAATTGRVFAGTAGAATPTAAAGAQILNAQCLIADASTFTRTARTLSGSSVVSFNTVTGMYPGQAISGTGIPASSVISALGADGTTVLIGSAVGTLVTATATGSVTATMTNTGYGICRFDRACYQGQIT